MKKINAILIVVIYLASIVIISVFGMKAHLYKEVIPVTSVVCQNETDENITVEEDNGMKVIYATFVEGEDTQIALNCKVLPDNATNKRLRYTYNRDKYTDEYITPVVDAEGNELGLFLVHKKVLFEMKIYSTDGTEKFVRVTISVR